MTISVGLYVFWILYPLTEHTRFNLFQARDVKRALEWISGHPVWFGPELSGGGHTPGPFYYWLLAVPLLLGGSYQAVVQWQILLFALACAAMFYFLEKSSNYFFGILGVLLYLNSGTALFNLLATWNPSFLPIFAILILALLSRCFEQGFPQSNPHWFFACLLLGLSVQIHFSTLQFLLLIIVFQFIGPKINLYRIPASRLSFGLLLILALQLPYLIDVLRSDSNGSTIVDGAKYYLASISGRWQTVNTNKAGLLLGLFNGFDTRFVAEGAWDCLIFFFAGVMLFAKKFRQALKTSGGLQKKYAIILVSVGLLLVLASPWQLTLNRMRYASIFLLGLAILASLTFYSIWLAWLKKNIPLTAQVVVAVAILALLSLRPFNWWAHGDPFSTIHPASLTSTYRLPSLREVRAFDQYLRGDLGWSIDQIIQSTFYLGYDPDFNLSALELLPPRPVRKEIKAVGHFLSPKLNGVHTEQEWHEALLNMPLPMQIREALRSGQMSLGKAVEFDKDVLIPYEIQNGSGLSRWIQNGGYWYFNAPEDKILAPFNKKDQLYEVSKLEDGRTLLVIHMCQIADLCKIGVLVNLSVQPTTKQTDIEMTFLGAPLSIGNLNSSIELEGIRAKIFCANKRYDWLIADRMGGTRLLSPAHRLDYFRSPITFRKVIPCRDRQLSMDLSIGKSLRGAGLTGKVPRLPPITFQL